MQNSLENICDRVSFLIKLQMPGLELYLKKRFWVVSCKICQILQTPFFTKAEHVQVTASVPLISQKSFIVDVRLGSKYVVDYARQTNWMVSFCCKFPQKIFSTQAIEIWIFKIPISAQNIFKLCTNKIYNKYDKVCACENYPNKNYPLKKIFN